MHVLAFSSLKDIPSHYKIISCGVSGGTYREYLHSMLQKYGNNTCLLLEPISRYFPLPDYTGQGEIITSAKIKLFQKNYDTALSKSLCTNYIFLPEKPAMILFDTDETLHMKATVADECKIPILAAETVFIKKLRLLE